MAAFYMLLMTCIILTSLIALNELDTWLKTIFITVYEAQISRYLNIAINKT